MKIDLHVEYTGALTLEYKGFSLTITSSELRHQVVKDGIVGVSIYRNTVGSLTGTRYVITSNNADGEQVYQYSFGDLPSALTYAFQWLYEADKVSDEIGTDY